MALADSPKGERLDNTPPKIIVSQRPAVLVYVDGPPAWRPVAGTKLQRAINTRMLLLKDKANENYLHLFDGYLQAPSLNGPWSVAKTPPPGADVALKQATDSGQVDLMQGAADTNTLKMPSLSSTPPPDVYVATQPAELITFNGPPDYASIPGTDLLYASNTSGNVFKLVTDQQNYILISGRWYRSASLNGPWRFVPGNQLPQDFANIPGRQSERKCEGQHSGHAPGRGSAHRQQHSAKHGNPAHHADVRAANGRRSATRAHRRHAAALHREQRHADHRGGPAIVVCLPGRRVVCRHLRHRPVDGGGFGASGDLHHPAGFAVALPDLRSSLRCDAEHDL